MIWTTFWLYFGCDTSINCIIAPTDVPEVLVILPNATYYRVAYDNAGNVTGYEMDGSVEAEYNVMTPYTLKGGEMGCAYVTKKGLTKVNISRSSPAPAPTPGTGVKTNMLFGFAISAVLAGVVVAMFTINKKKKYSK